jgi:type VI secretion system protein
MGREQMLLDRIASGGRPGDGRVESSAGEDVETLAGSVRRNLIRLLNARHGFSEAVPDYGLPALTDLTVGSANYAPAIQEAIRTTIEKYEPRLRRVRVSRVVDEEAQRTLSFRVDAILIGRSGEHRVCYETELTGSGQFSVLK